MNKNGIEDEVVKDFDINDHEEIKARMDFVLTMAYDVFGRMVSGKESTADARLVTIYFKDKEDRQCYMDLRMELPSKQLTVNGHNFVVLNHEEQEQDAAFLAGVVVAAVEKGVENGLTLDYVKYLGD